MCDFCWFIFLRERIYEYYVASHGFFATFQLFVYNTSLNSKSNLKQDDHFNQKICIKTKYNWL